MLQRVGVFCASLPTSASSGVVLRRPGAHRWSAGPYCVAFLCGCCFWPVLPAVFIEGKNQSGSILAHPAVVMGWVVSVRVARQGSRLRSLEGICVRVITCV